MASVAKVYQEEMHGNVGFYATWLPGDEVAVGDIGTIEGGRFRKATSLKELGVAMKVSGKASPQDLQYTSRSGASVKVGTAASLAGVPGVSAEIEIQFTRAGAFLFHAAGLRQVRLEERGALAAAVAEVYLRGEWKKEWFLVEALHHADCATVIVAEDGAAGLVLKAKAPVSLGSLPLANPDVHLDVQATHGRLMHLLAARGLKPLYSCLKMKDGWFSDPALVAVRGTSAPTTGDALVRSSIADLLDS